MDPGRSARGAGPAYWGTGVPWRSGTESSVLVSGSTLLTMPGRTAPEYTRGAARIRERKSRGERGVRPGRLEAQPSSHSASAGVVRARKTINGRVIVG